MKTFIISIPKSGTYLIREIMENAGFGKSHLHVSESGLFDYSKISFEEGRRNPRKCKTYMPLKVSLKKIPDNSFAVGHLMYSKEAINLLKDFNIIFIGRNPKEVYLSFMIYQLETGRALRYKEDLVWANEKTPRDQFIKFIKIRGDKLMTKYFTKILPWMKQEGVSCFDFNTMLSNPMEETNRLLLSLNKKFAKARIKEIVDNSFGRKTQTLSGKKDRSIYWCKQSHQLIDSLIEKYKVKYDL